MRLSIVIPAFNEAHRIAKTLATVQEFCERELSQWEIIVVDDGSLDGTASACAGVRHVQVFRNERNRGKGYSVKRGMLAAGLDPVLFMDADLSTPIEESRPLHEALQQGSAVAIASRRPHPGKEVRRTPSRKLMAHVFRLLVKLLAFRGFYDTQCGFKMFRRSAVGTIFPLQRLEHWGFDVEVLFIARKKGLRIAEVPVSWQESSESKLKFATPLSMVLDLLRLRWNDLRGKYESAAEEGRGK